jgi:SnoaL-like domain
MPLVALAVVLWLLSPSAAAAQATTQKPTRGTPPPASPSQSAPASPQRSTAAVSTPEDVVREWFRRWNALDGTDASIRRLIDLYTPDGINQVPPSPTQIGSVYMVGPDGVRKMAEDFLRDFTQPASRIDKIAEDGKTAELFFKTQGPWGGPAVGVQYTQQGIDKVTKKRYSLPAFVVFHIQDGKIRYARFYGTRTETREE